MPVNSLMSAPAINPLFLAEMTTTPRGGSRSRRASSPSSSSSTLPESTLAEEPGLSRVSQAMPSESRSSFQELPGVSFMSCAPWGESGSGGGSSARRGAHLEVAYQRPVIGEVHVGHAEVGDLDALAHQDEVELDARHARGE